MDRRTFLTASTAAVGASVAGCSDSLMNGGSEDDTDDGDEEGTPDGGADGPTTPEWAKWVPAEAFAEGSDADVFTVDIDEARQKFPEEEYADLNIQRLARALEIEESALNTITILLRDFGPTPGVILGEFTKQEVLEAADPSDAETEEYRGLTIADDTIGFGDGAIVLGENFRTLVDARFGDVESMPEGSEEWPLIQEVAPEWDLYGLTDGYYGDSFEYELSKSGLTIDAVGDGRGRFTSIFLFEDRETAETAFDEGEESLTEEARRNEEMTLQSVDQSGRVLTFTFDTDSLADVLSDTGGGSI